MNTPTSAETETVQPGSPKAGGAGSKANGVPVRPVAEPVVEMSKATAMLRDLRETHLTGNNEQAEAWAAAGVLPALMSSFRNVDKIRAYPGPTLIIHAEDDHIIPVSDGQALYDASAAPDKTLLKIPRANHNDILLRAGMAYFQAVGDFISGA